MYQPKAENDAMVKHYFRQKHYVRHLLHIQVLNLRWWRQAWRIKWLSSMQQLPACGISCGGSSCMLLSRPEWLSGTLACPRSGVACCGAPSGLPTNASSDTCAWLLRSASVAAAAAAVAAAVSAAVAAAAAVAVAVAASFCIRTWFEAGSGVIVFSGYHGTYVAAKVTPGHCSKVSKARQSNLCELNVQPP